MDTVTVAELKAKLSHYLREVREGRSFTVLSRDIPVARLGPWDVGDTDDLEVIPADPQALGLFARLLGPSSIRLDGAELISRDRAESDARLDGSGSAAPAPVARNDREKPA